MNSTSRFSRRRNGSLALVIVNFVLQILLTTQLYSSFGRIPSTAAAASAKNQVPYRLLATVLQEKLSETSEYGEAPTVAELTKTLSKLASNQQTFKGLDGVAHEAYQRTHSGDDVTDTSVSGRAQRSAARLAAVAEALYACELVEIAEQPGLSLSNEDNEKQLLPNVTVSNVGSIL